MNILSIENALTWSWGLTMPGYMDQWDYAIARIVRQPKIEVRLICDTCGEMNVHTLDPVRLNRSLLKHFDIVLLQNIDTLPLMDELNNVICRIGGMVVNENDTHRYDEWLSQCAAVVSTNSFLTNIGLAANENTALIPNGLDLEQFKPLPDRPDRKFTVGFAGNVHGPGMHYKGYKFFSQAAIDMWAEVNHLKRLHAHNQLAHDDMVAEFYHQIDCLVLPSLGEGCSNVTMEALACGVPVLTTPVGFHGERLTHMKDCLFISRNNDDIKVKIRLLKDNPEIWQTLSENGRNFAVKHHDINVIARRYDDVFRDALERLNNGGQKSNDIGGRGTVSE